MHFSHDSFFERCTAAEQNNPQQTSVHKLIEKPMIIDCKHNVVLGNLTLTCYYLFLLKETLFTFMTLESNTT